MQEQPGPHSALKDSGTGISSVQAPASVLLFGLFGIHTGKLEEQAGRGHSILRSPGDVRHIWHLQLLCTAAVTPQGTQGIPLLAPLEATSDRQFLPPSNLRVTTFDVKLLITPAITVFLKYLVKKPSGLDTAHQDVSQRCSCSPKAPTATKLQKDISLLCWEAPNTQPFKDVSL